MTPSWHLEVFRDRPVAEKGKSTRKKRVRLRSLEVESKRRLVRIVSAAFLNNSG